jgi:hypothetical protein
VKAVAAIDPIVDWDVTLDEAEGATRAWYYENYGLPLAHAGRYALRTPSTFAGVIDAPTLLVDRADDQVHLPLLRSLLDGLERPYWFESATGESVWAGYARAATFLTKAFAGTLEAPVAAEEPLTEIEPPPVVLDSVIEEPVVEAAERELIDVPADIERELPTAQGEPIDPPVILEPETVSAIFESVPAPPVAPVEPAAPIEPEPAAEPAPPPPPARPHVRADEI